MSSAELFDVFLAHNTADKPQVRVIANKLREHGLNPWLDEEQIPPGGLFQVEIQKAIPQIKSATIIIGVTGLGKWQAIELQALIGQFVEKGSPVIPVLLPGVDKIPDQDYLLFLKQFNWVSFRDINDDSALDKLKWGIKGVKPHLHPPSSASGQGNKTPVRPVSEVKKDPVELLSAKGIDYQVLEQLLEAQEWRIADELTTIHMLKVANREKEGWLNEDSIKTFPCEDLQTIDRLWVHYSNGKFGFSVQKKLWLECSSKIDDEYNDEVFKKFAAKVGWYHPQIKWRTDNEFMRGTKNAENALSGGLPRGWLTTTKEVNYGFVWLMLFLSGCGVFYVLSLGQQVWEFLVIGFGFWAAFFAMAFFVVFFAIAVCFWLRRYMPSFDDLVSQSGVDFRLRSVRFLLSRRDF